jgi:MoaA/NifB/PqqE/SkfB family radical SAM enzyme
MKNRKKTKELIASPTIKTGAIKFVVEKLILLNLVKITLSINPDPLKLVPTFRKLLKIRKAFLGTQNLTKIIKSGNHFFWDMHSPGWPSKSFNAFYRDEILRAVCPDKKSSGAKLIVFSITNKCPLRCEHCYEIENLGNKESLSAEDLIDVISRLKRCGLTKVGISGGEPMARFNDMLAMITKFGKEIDFWVLTSGYQMTEENARKLKKAGAKGLSISADHYIPELHNAFRNSSEAFGWMESAARNGISAGLAICLTICATKEFVTRENMTNFALMARNMGASFIQVVEPHAAGAYKDRQVSLSKEQTEILENFFLEMNYDPKFRKFPVVAYHAFHQRRMGCIANANRYFFVDSSGNIHPCHFCRANMGNVLDEGYEQAIERLRNYKGCRTYPVAEINFASVI